MTYGEYFLMWLKRILLVLLIIAIAGMAITSIAKAKRATAGYDALIARVDASLERGMRR